MELGLPDPDLDLESRSRLFPDFLDPNVTVSYFGDAQIPKADPLVIGISMCHTGDSDHSIHGLSKSQTR